MKRNNIFKGLSALAVAATLAACSSDYLDLQPISQVSNDEITSDETAMRLVVYGMCESMYCQYSSLYDFRWFNGEPWFSMVYGDVNGQDYISLFWQNSLVTVANWGSINRNTYTADFIPWVYGYNLINPANMVISADNPENAENIKGEFAFRLAQAYTLRAHAYYRLHQVYGPAWGYSDNGQALSVILRTEATNADTDPNAPLATTNEVLNQIYSDLDRALELYKISNFSREYTWEPDMSVAQGIYARAALLKTDQASWQKAYDMAKAAQEGYSIMEAQEYKMGFASPTSEWMWASPGSSAGIYFASFGATYACNGAYPCNWATVGAGAIDYNLYKQVQNANDVRCELYFTPDKVNRQLQAQFYRDENCDPATMDINFGPDLAPAVQEFAMNLYDEIGRPNGWIAPFNYNYFDQATLGIDLEGQTIQFGAQFKFWGTDSYSSSSFPYMRASEMLLVEAEAACHLGLYSEAQKCLDAVNSKRISGYTGTTKTGDDLLNEVKLYRRFELWGEGFSWFDYKRWEEAIDREEWDPTTRSGNWTPSLSGTLEPGLFNGWKWAIPQAESLYNTAITQTDDQSM